MVVIIGIIFSGEFTVHSGNHLARNLRHMVVIIGIVFSEYTVVIVSIVVIASGYLWCYVSLAVCMTR